MKKVGSMLNKHSVLCNFFVANYFYYLLLCSNTQNRKTPKTLPKNTTKRNLITTSRKRTHSSLSTLPKLAWKKFS